MPLSRPPFYAQEKDRLCLAACVRGFLPAMELLTPLPPLVADPEADGQRIPYMRRTFSTRESL